VCVFICRNGATEYSLLLSLVGLAHFIKTFTLLFLPIEVHPGAIQLRDPVVELIGGGRVFVRDLFFSGHVAFLLLMLYIDNFILFGVASVIVSYCLLKMRIHYSIDILVPFIVYALVA
jgi:hypothetical protein